MKKVLLLVVVVLVLGILTLPNMVAQAHNAGHLILPSGECLNVGSLKRGPFVSESNPHYHNIPGSPDNGRLDLMPGLGDQYGARFAAEQGNSAVLPGECP